MLAKVQSCAVIGLEGALVEVEVDLSNGLAAFNIVGLPDAAINESRERVRSASDAPISSKGMGFQARPLASVTIPQRDQLGWWLRRCAHLDNTGASGLPLPVARVRADYDVPPGDSSLFCRLSRKGPGRRYVSEDG